MHFRKIYFLFYVCVLSECMTVFVWCSLRPEGGVRSLGTGIRDCYLTCGCWGFNLGPLKEQPVFITFESSLASVIKQFYNQILIY